MNNLTSILSPRLTSRISAKALPTMQVVFRIGVGLLFMQHGAQKLFGWLGGMDGAGATASLFSQMGVAGLLEFFGGLMIVLGLLTRPVALILAAEMVIAYFMAHAPQGTFPILNGGELAVFYALSFALLFATGAGKWSIDNALFGQRSATGDDAHDVTIERNVHAPMTDRAPAMHRDRTSTEEGRGTRVN